MNIETFTEKMQEQGYEVRYESNSYEGCEDRLVISKQSYYHVAILPQHVFGTPFNYLLNMVEREIANLEQEERMKSSK